MKRNLVLVAAIAFVALLGLSCTSPVSSTTSSSSGSRNVTYTLSATNVTTAYEISYMMPSGSFTTITNVSLPWSVSVALPSSFSVCGITALVYAPSSGSTIASITVSENGSLIGSTSNSGSNGNTVTVSLTPTL